MITIPCAAIALDAAAPDARAGCRADVPTAAVGLTALPPVAQERRSVATACIRAEVLAPSIRTGGAVSVPAAQVVVEAEAPEASEVRPPQKRSAKMLGMAPMSSPLSWEPWLIDGTAYVIVEERDYIDTWESIAETAIGEAPAQDVLSARIRHIGLQAYAPTIRGGGSAIVPSISIMLVAAVPQGVGRPRSPTIQIIAS